MTSSLSSCAGLSPLHPSKANTVSCEARLKSLLVSKLWASFSGPMGLVFAVSEGGRAASRSHCSRQAGLTARAAPRGIRRPLTVGDLWPAQHILSFSCRIRRSVVLPAATASRGCSTVDAPVPHAMIPPAAPAGSAVQPVEGDGARRKPAAGGARRCANVPRRCAVVRASDSIRISFGCDSK
jgi:hypothetical protein